MLGLLTGCGLRRSELVELTADQLQREQHWVILDLIGKGGRLRTAPMPDWLKGAKRVGIQKLSPRKRDMGLLSSVSKFLQTLLISPRTGASSVRTMYYLSIVCARESIYIANPYFVPDPVAIETLIEAKRRGVDVRIMVSGIRNDAWVARQSSVRLFGRLLQAGIEIQEYNRTMLHHKTMVVDGRWVTIGTANFDNRSFAHNEESNVCFLDHNLANRLRAIFHEDLSACDRVMLRNWNRRGIWARIQEFLASLLQEQA